MMLTVLDLTRPPFTYTLTHELHQALRRAVHLPLPWWESNEPPSKREPLSSDLPLKVAGETPVDIDSKAGLAMLLLAINVEGPVSGTDRDIPGRGSRASPVTTTVPSLRAWPAF